MKVNALPKYDSSDNPTQCCPRFNPEGWDDQELHFKDKLFVEAHTRSAFHIPINMGSVFSKVMNDIEKTQAFNEEEFIVLSRDPSAWESVHYFSVNKDVQDEKMTTISGDFVTKVFEGPYRDAPKWEKQMQEFVQNKGKEVKQTFFFYTTCPKCAKYYGKNYVVLVAEIE